MVSFRFYDQVLADSDHMNRIGIRACDQCVRVTVDHGNRNSTGDRNLLSACSCDCLRCKLVAIHIL